jgi:WD40 repeat protein/Ni2+-binding GTPase involved in maturation of urease and hydrogenase
VGGVFINYRTGDGEFAATLITRVLSARFGEEHVFLASRSIRPGEDFARKILEQLARSDVLLAIIGARWHSVTDRQRRRQTAGDEHDWVHREIAEAFRHGLRVIPVFLDHAVPLTEAELPQDIAALARCQFLRLSHRNDTRDLARLVEELGDVVPDLLLDRVFTDSPPPSRNSEPSTWLRPEYRIAPFAGRDEELGDLAGWLGTPKPVSARLVTGPAGLGKTRLAQQLCQDMAGRGWITGIVRDNATIADLTNLGGLDRPVLVVVDNAETRFEEIHALAAALTERAPTAPPARLLLLSRETGDWLHRLRTHTNDRVSGLFRVLDEHQLGPLATTVAERGAEFQRALTAYAGHLDLPVPDLRAPGDLAHHRYASTRIIHATALITLLTEHSGQTGAVPTPDPELHRTARPESPYRGLRPFQEQDARVFWGRDPQVHQLETLLEQHTMVMVTGASGSGKSSLVRAGLLPLLREQDIAVTVLRPAAGAAPFDLLANAVAPIVGNGRAAGADLALLADAIVEAAGHWVLFVDQFEELVAAAPGQADELLALVAELVRAAPPRPAGTPALRAVFTGLSADPAVLPHTVPLPRMGPAELRAAIAGPTDLPLVSFEPGLVDRIIADATDAPGQLPLVELTLTRLWESAQGGTLTHRAYDDQGGVAGALASYAEEVCTRRLLPDELNLAERLLVQLARPGEHGTFTLTPVRLDELDPASRDMARTFAKHHLVVLRVEVGQPETVALAHEALVHQWRQLREWLVAAQDFRSWQEQLRSALRQWQQAGRDPGTLLHGTPLTTAEDWQNTQPTRLTGEERDYITASRRHQRRGVRRWRLVTALIGVLALVATTSAALAISRNRELTDQLRRAAAATLGQEAERRSDTNPLTALQLTQAAWRQDPTSPEAYAALLRQHLKYVDADEIRSDLWSGTVDSVAATGDGRVTAVAEGDGKITVWTELFGSAPGRWFVATIPDQSGLLVSPDGRWLAVASRNGSIRLWDIDQRRGPLPMRPAPDPYDFQEPNSLASAAFSPDGQLLVVTLLAQGPAKAAGTSNLVEVWDVTQRQPALSGFTTGSPVEALSVSRVEPDGRSAWFGERHVDRTRHNVLRDLTTGAVLDATAADFITPDGLFAACGNLLSVLDPATDAVRLSRNVPGCPAPGAQGLTDLSGRYALFNEGSSEDSFQRLTLVDLTTGDVYSLHRPPEGYHQPADDLTTYNTESVIALPNESGPPAVFMFGTGALVRFRATGPVGDLAPATPTPAPGLTALTPDGSRLVTLTEQGLLAFDVVTGRQVGGGTDTTAGKLRLAASPQLTFSEDGKRLLAIGDTGDLVVLSATDFTTERRIPVGVPHPDLGLDPAMMKTSIVPMNEDEVAILRGASVAMWRLGTGEQRFDWLSLRGGDATQLRDFAAHAAANALPSYSHLLLVTSTSGNEVWDLATGSLMRSIQPRPGNQAAAVVTESGPSRVALHYRGDGQLELWSPDQDRRTSRPVPMPGDLSLVGFSQDGKLVADAGNGGLQVWDPAVGISVADFHTPGSPGGWSLRNNRLVAATANRPLSIDLTPQRWIDHLCRLSSRDYSQEERELLPPGVDPAPPCAPPGR